MRSSGCLSSSVRTGKSKVGGGIERVTPEREGSELSAASLRLAAIASVLLAGTFAGCANNQTTATSANANPPAKTYTGTDLEKTGRQQSGEALQAADPAVSTSSGR